MASGLRSSSAEGLSSPAECAPRLRCAIQLDAARTTEQQATARYRTGLGNISDVADAERLLTQAEIDDSLARLGVWRALLGIAAAQGDLRPFLDLANR